MRRDAARSECWTRFQTQLSRSGEEQAELLASREHLRGDQSGDESARRSAQGRGESAVATARTFDGAATPLAGGPMAGDFSPASAAGAIRGAPRVGYLP